MPRFPRVTETYVLFEIEALLASGREVRIYPLLQETFDFEHAAVARLRPRVRFQPLFSGAVWGANALFLLRHPLRYALALLTLILVLARSPGQLLGSLRLFPKTVAYARDMQRQNVAHVHAHFADIPATAAWLIHRLIGMPFSFTVHGADLHRAQVGMATKLKGAQFAAQVSEYNRSLILERVGDWATGKLPLVRCGIELSTVSEAAAGPAEIIANDRFTILCVASLRPARGHVELLGALEILKKSAIPFACRLVGDGPEREALRALTEELGLVGDVEFVGHQNHAAAEHELQTSDAVLLLETGHDSDQREGISQILMRAMARSRPVIATDSGGTPELITSGVEGFLVPPNDTAALALALTRLWEDDQLRIQMGAAGLARITSEYNLRTNALLLARLFDSTLGPLPKSRPKRPRIVSR